MARLFPQAHVKKRGSAWRFWWFWQGQQYEFSLLLPDEHAAGDVLRLVNLALEGVAPWPEPTADAPAVLRWLDRDRAPAVPPPGDLLSAYEPHLRSEVSARWADNSLSYLRAFRDSLSGGLADATPERAQAYLDAVARRRTKATRNRHLAVLSRFYRWAVRHGVPANPVAGIRQLREPEPEEIAYLTRVERDALLEAPCLLPDKLAVWIACYAGLRVGEIQRLGWESVNLPQARLVVTKSKTGKRRVVPLAGPLKRVLAAIPAPQRKGRVIGWPESENAWRGRGDMLVARLKREPACAAFADRIGWTPFRHTFGSLLAQAGVSLDKISAWMGNTPAVCRRHYAEFVPRDAHDEDVEKL